MSDIEDELKSMIVQTLMLKDIQPQEIDVDKPLFADGLEEVLPARLRPLAEQARARAETKMQQIAPDVTAAEGPSS